MHKSTAYRLNASFQLKKLKEVERIFNWFSCVLSVLYIVLYIYIYYILYYLVEELKASALFLEYSFLKAAKKETPLQLFNFFNCSMKTFSTDLQLLQLKGRIVGNFREKEGIYA